MQKCLDSKRSEFVAVYGRRRVGKTFLIKEFFNYSFAFSITGIANATTTQQLFNFDTEMGRQSHLTFDGPSPDWLHAFQRLRQHLEMSKSKGKTVVFIDELPWFDTHGSDFLIALEHFWNAWATNRKDILLITCGSAASWMLNQLINNTGGLHNRVTALLKIEPFTLRETEQMLKAKHCNVDSYQLAELYMCMGGIPYYLDAIDPSLSAAQNIQELFFEKNGLLNHEFHNLYRSLFKRHDIYEKVVEVLSGKPYGLPRAEMIKLSGVESGGTFTKVLADLEESGFIASCPALHRKHKHTIYRISDYYTAFYFRFLAGARQNASANWMQMTDHPAHRAWQGYTFEQVCIDHIGQIKKALGISGIEATAASWAGGAEDQKTQIDLLIDRRDHVINLCECKFSLDKYTITKAYAEALKRKVTLFKEATKTKKAVHLVFISTHGLNRNSYSDMLVQREILLDDLVV